MVQELVKEPVKSVDPPEQGLHARIILKFFLLWLGSLLLLVMIALLSNIEWARRHIETALYQSFHRQVRLGRLSWSFGLHGLAIDSDRLVMKDRDGGPFISSGPSEIGIAFLPLFQKRLVIKHLQFEHPEVFAVRLTDKLWNFSDLITEGPEIHMVQIENGLLHVRNQAHKGAVLSSTGRTQTLAGTAAGSGGTAQTLAGAAAGSGGAAQTLAGAAAGSGGAAQTLAGAAAGSGGTAQTLAAAAQALAGGNWQDYDLKDMKLSATLPYHDHNWPFFLSCKVPVSDESGRTYESSIRLSATGKGPIKDWHQNKYSIDLQLQNFDTQRFRSLYAGMPQIRGICDLHFKGDGIFDRGFSATASGTVNNLKIAGAESKELDLAKVGASCNLLIDPQTLSWKDLKLSLSDWQLDSDGKLFNWQKETSSYEARVGGKLNDLRGFFDQVISCFLPEKATEAHKKFAAAKLDRLNKAQKAGELTGSATIELHLQGTKQEHSVATCIKAEGIPLAQLIDDETGTSVIEAFKLNPSAPIRGELNIDPGKRLEVKDLEIPLEDSKLKLTGFIDRQSNHCKFDFAADNLSFDTFKKRLGDNELMKAICASNGKSKPYSLSGRLDIKGSYTSDGKQPQVFIDSTLKGLRLKKQDAAIATCSNIKGQIVYDNGTVKLKKLSGTSPGSANTPGDFLVNGSFSLQDAGPADIDLHAHEISIVQIKDWLKRCGLKLSQPGLDKLSGDLHELKAHVSMHNAQTSMSFTVNPADLVLEAAGKAGDGGPGALRLTSGTISYIGRELTARDVTLSGRGGKLTISGTMQGNLDALKLASAHLTTDGFELGDLQSILKANLNPPRSAPALPEFMIPCRQASLHGKIYGDLNYTNDGNTSSLIGVMGFNNAGGKFGKSQVAVEKLTGVTVITRDQLVVQETSGQIGKSTFSLDGVISNYSTPNYSWQGQLRGQFYPDEVDTIMDNLGHGIALDALSQEALNLRVTGSGEKGNASCNFRGKASATYGLGLKTAFGTFHQPKGRPLYFHGGLNLSEADSQIALSGFQLTSGSEHLQASGTFKWANEQAEKPASLSFSLSTPSPVKSETLCEIISQRNTTTPAQIGGTSQLNLKVEGPVNDLVLSGTLALDKNSFPSVHLENLTGKLELPGWHLCRATSADSSNSTARLQLSTLSMGGLSLHDAGVALCLDNSSSKIIFKDFQAALSGGKLTMAGFYNPENQSYHADIKVSKLVVDEFVKDLIDHSGGFSGLADLTLSLDDSGFSPRSLAGTGQFSVYQGSVASFGKLQEKLNESNLLQQGLFGFNVNNLLQAMMPVKSGQFNEVSGSLSFSRGNICFDGVRFEGNNLRMRAAGKFDYLAHQMNLDVAGDIPRVSSSIIPGAIGEMSRKVTLQRMFSIVTFKKLKDLPALPLLGDIANDDPRAFSFAVATPTEPPKLITDAVEKSFKWLPNKPFASAHPVPGM